MTQYTLGDVVGDQDAGCAIESMVLMAGLLDRAAIDRGVTACEQALAIGPIVDPTAFRDGHSRCQQTLRVLKAAARFVDEVRSAMEGKGTA